MIFESFFERIHQRRDVVTCKAGNPKTLVMLNHIDVQGVPGGRRADEAHIGQLVGIARFMQPADIVCIEGVMGYC